MNHPRDPGTVKLLLDHGVDINVHMKGIGPGKIFRGNTALHFVASPPQTDIAEILLSHGADVNAKNAEGVTPLGIALKYGSLWLKLDYKPVIELLRRYGGHE